MEDSAEVWKQRFLKSEAENAVLCKALERLKTYGVNLEDYRKAQQIVKDYRICGNGGVGCGKLFRLQEPTYEGFRPWHGEVTETIQYGQHYWWCKKCYPSIKDD